MSKKLKKDAAFFATGGAGYGIIELLWRGHTHWSMLIAGGMCFTIFSRIAERCRKRSLIYKAVLCSMSVTVVEFGFGIVFNKILKMNVWDYSKMPYNILGQICPLYTVLWGALGLIFVPVAEQMNKRWK